MKYTLRTIHHLHIQIDKKFLETMYPDKTKLQDLFNDVKTLQVTFFEKETKITPQTHIQKF